MAQDDPKKQAGQSGEGSSTGAERAARKQPDQALRKEMDRRDRILLGEIHEVRNLVTRVAEASAFQFSLENSLQEISDKLTPIKDLSPQPAEPDEIQAAALIKIRSELARPIEEFMYRVEAAGRGSGEAAS